MLGAVYVTTALIAVQTLGAGGVTAATIAGQLAMSVFLDRVGALGLEQRGLTPLRVLGVALLAVGTILVVRSSGSSIPCQGRSEHECIRK